MKCSIPKTANEADQSTCCRSFLPLSPGHWPPGVLIFHSVLHSDWFSISHAHTCHNGLPTVGLLFCPWSLPPLTTFDHTVGTPNPLPSSLIMILPPSDASWRWKQLWLPLSSYAVLPSPLIACDRKRILNARHKNLTWIKWMFSPLNTGPLTKATLPWI